MDSRFRGNHEHLAPSILKLKQNRNILNLYALQPAWILATRAGVLECFNHEITAFILQFPRKRLLQE